MLLVCEQLVLSVLLHFRTPPPPFPAPPHLLLLMTHHEKMRRKALPRSPNPNPMAMGGYYIYVP